MKKLFTLMELLVVMTIIFFLLSLFLPALKSVRDSAKNISCLNNIKQVSLAMYAYAGDYNGLICLGTFKVSPIATRPWLAVINGRGSHSDTPAYPQAFPVYLSNLKMAVCPSAIEMTRTSPASYWWTDTYGTCSQSDFPDKLLCADGFSGWGGFLNLNRMPVSFPFLFDSMTYIWGTFTPVTTNSVSTNPSDISPSGIHLRHQNKSNSLFSDGSVKGLQSADLKAKGYNRGYSQIYNRISF